MAKQYHILTANTTWELEKDVNSWIERDFIPTGGVSAVTTASGYMGGGSHNVEYHQAIYKPPKESASGVFIG